MLFIKNLQSHHPLLIILRAAQSFVGWAISLGKNKLVVAMQDESIVVLKQPETNQFIVPSFINAYFC